MEEQVLTYKLLLADTGAEVSQPIAMGDANQFQVNVWIESSSTLLGTFPVRATMQTSPDLDNWTDTYQEVTLSSAPSSGTASTDSYYTVADPYIRLRYQGGGCYQAPSA